jgi:uncharacterized protein YbjT (DUF2867 family)
MSDRTLLVGATGQIGSQLLSQFSAAGQRVRALVRDKGKADGLRGLADPVFGDLLSPDSLGPAFTDVERVFVLAPPIGPAQQVMERNAFNAAMEAGAKRIVYLASYPSIWGSGFPYVVHAAGEKHLATLNVDWTVLRPTRFIPFTPFVWTSVVREGLLLEQAGDGMMTTIAPADVAAIGFLALTTAGHEGKAYDLTSEDAFSTRQLGRFLSAALKKPITVFDGDVQELRLALIKNGAPGEYAPTMSNYFGSVQDGRWKVTDTVARLLGRKPESYAHWLEHNLPGIVARAG